MKRCDCFVSLHRSEGFGRGIAEALLLEKPVIVTGYSGNMDFTNPQNACIVDYQLVDVGPDEYPHAAGQGWADPDLEQAAELHAAGGERSGVGRGARKKRTRAGEGPARRRGRRAALSGAAGKTGVPVEGETSGAASRKGLAAPAARATRGRAVGARTCWTGRPGAWDPVVREPGGLSAAPGATVRGKARARAGSRPGADVARLLHVLPSPARLHGVRRRVAGREREPARRARVPGLRAEQPAEADLQGGRGVRGLARRAAEKARLRCRARHDVLPRGSPTASRKW